MERIVLYQAYCASTVFRNTIRVCVRVCMRVCARACASGVVRACVGGVNNNTRTGTQHAGVNNEYFYFFVQKRCEFTIFVTDEHILLDIISSTYDVNNTEEMTYGIL